MTCSDFQYLPYEKKVALLYRDAVYLSKIKTDSYTVLLYQLDAFYIELYYFNYRNEIELINCFESTDLLDPYLETVNLEELINC